MHKDRFNQDLQIGDTIVTMRKNYRELVTAKIIKFTPTKIRVEYQGRYSSAPFEEYLVDPCDVVKAPIQ